MNSEIETEEQQESEAQSLADELGTIGTQTVDGDKIKDPVEKCDILAENQVRLWYRFPGKTYISETFEKPFPWSIYDNKLARIIDYTVGLEPSNFSEITKSTDVEILLKETATDVLDDDEVEELREASPGPLYIEANSGKPTRSPTTWESVDPKTLVDDDRYVDPEDRDDEEEEPSGPEWFQGGKETFEAGIGPGIIVGIILAVILAAMFLF